MIKKLFIVIFILLLPLRSYCAEQEFVPDMDTVDQELKMNVLNEEIRKITDEIQDGIHTGDDAVLGDITTDDIDSTTATIGTINATTINQGGAALVTGKILKVVLDVDTSTGGSYSTTMAMDNGKPSSSEGTELFTYTYSPEEDDSTLYVFTNVKLSGADNQDRYYISALFKGSETDALAANWYYYPGSKSNDGIAIDVLTAYSYVLSSSSNITFKVRAGISGAGGWFYNKEGSTAYTMGGLNNSWILIIEVAA